MTEAIVRYAIQFPDGKFSNGPQCKPVEFEKAKLWKRRGHLTNRLGQFVGYSGRYNPRQYPPGTKIVEVTIQPALKELATVSEEFERLAGNRQQRHAENEKRWAERELEAAQARLDAAKRKLGRA